MASLDENVPGNLGRSIVSSSIIASSIIARYIIASSIVDNKIESLFIFASA